MDRTESQGDDRWNSPDSLSSSKQSTPKSWYRCCVCGTTSRRTPERKFFRFPKDPNRSKQWAAACSNETVLNASPTKLYRTSRVCSAHFKDADYCSTKMRYLHSCAVPTKFEETGIEVSKKIKLDIGILQSNLREKLQSTAEEIQTATEEVVEDTSQQYLDQNIPLGNIESPSQDKTRLMNTGKVFTPKSQKIRHLTNQVSYLKRKYKRARNHCSLNDILQMIRPLVTYSVYNFIKGQLKASSVSKYGRRWSLEDKNLCLQVYLTSPKTYNVLKAFLHLPSKPTLLKTISNIYLEPGFSAAVLNAMRLAISKLKYPDKYCILSFDEMSLKSNLVYDKKNDRIVGFEDYGSYSKAIVIPDYATHAVVFMVRGLCKKWKQVFGYFFASHTTPGFMLCTLVMEALSKLFDCGLTPVAIVCDGGANNVMCYTKAMKVTEDKPYIMCQDKKVFTLFDVPHLLKCLRNNFCKYDVKFLNDHIASWEHIKSLWEFDSKMTHRCVPKLSDRHVNVDGLSAMSVKLAAQVFSHSVASGLCYLSALGALPASASHTADFCSNVNKLFDSLNSCKIKHANDYLSAVSKNSVHLETWAKMLDFIRSIEFQTKKKISFPSLFGWKLTLSAFQQLIPILLQEVPFILMCRFTQDALENFFSVVRRRGGNNDHPTAYDFQQRLRILMAQNIISISKLSNCEPDNDTVLIPAELLTVTENSEPFLGNEENELKIDFNDPVFSSTDSASNVPDADALYDVYDQNSSAYVAGFIAKRALKQFECCILCRSLLKTEKSLDVHTYFLYFKEFDNVRDGLFYPSQQFTLSVCEMGQKFKILYDKLCHQKGIKSKITPELKNVSHDWLKCHLHAIQLWEYIVNSYVQLMIYFKLKEKSKSLEAKENVRKS